VLVHEKPSASLQVEIDSIIPIKIIFIGLDFEDSNENEWVFPVSPSGAMVARVLERHRIKSNLMVPADSGPTSALGAFGEQASP
jgi:hypothetical protein